MSNAERQLRATDETRGRARKEDKKRADVSGGGKVIELLRSEPDKPARDKLRLSPQVLRILTDPLARIGWQLTEDIIDDEGETCEVTLGIKHGYQNVYFLYLHPDLIAPRLDHDDEGSRSETAGEDLTFLGFMIPENSIVRIVSDYPQIPAPVPRVLFRWKRKFGIDAEWIPWNLVSAVAGDPGSVAIHFKLYDVPELGAGQPVEDGAAGAGTDQPDGDAVAAEGDPQPSREGVFISYSHGDRELMERVVDGFQQLRAEGHAIFTDTEIAPGERWRQRLEAELEKAKVMVLLVTPNFLASDFIQNEELGPALQAAASAGLTIFSIMVSTTPGYVDSPIAAFQFAYGPDNALDTLDDNEVGPALARTRDKLRTALEAD